EISAALRESHPSLPIAWGGYFPTLYPDAAINAPYVDFLVRGQGEETVLELLESLPDADALSEIRILTWKSDGIIHHNPERRFRQPDEFPPYNYDRLGDVSRYLRPSFMGHRTGVHQAAIGCRYKCTFCGVVSMFNGTTKLSAPARTQLAMKTLRDRYGAD